MRYVIAVLALAGAMVSGLALQVHYTIATTPCSINEKWDCGVVNHSSYSLIDGVPVALIGIVGYLGLRGSHSLVSVPFLLWLARGLGVRSLPGSCRARHTRRLVSLLRYLSRRYRTDSRSGLYLAHC